MAAISLEDRKTALSASATESALWERIEHTYRQAEACGAISQISSQATQLEDRSSGLPFVLQIAEKLKDKPKASPQPDSKKRTPDVFATEDTDLTVVQDFTASHMLRLNKFNVIPYHSLTITRQFESQQEQLSLGDWEATFQAMQAYPERAIAYFNSGEEAGASQPRKHLQILPASLHGAPTAPLPFQSVIEDAARSSQAAENEAFALRALPFQSLGSLMPERYGAADLHEACCRLQEARPTSTADAAYNVLVAHRSMMLVPRRQESCGPISCNALIFAGTMLVRSQAELDFIRERSPMQLIEAVTFPWDSD